MKVATYVTKGTYKTGWFSYEESYDVAIDVMFSELERAAIRKLKLQSYPLCTYTPVDFREFRKLLYTTPTAESTITVRDLLQADGQMTVQFADIITAHNISYEVMNNLAELKNAIQSLLATPSIKTWGR